VKIENIDLYYLNGLVSPVKESKSLGCMKLIIVIIFYFSYTYEFFFTLLGIELVHQRNYTLNFTQKRVPVLNIAVMVDTGARLLVKFKVTFLWCSGSVPNLVWYFPPHRILIITLIRTKILLLIFLNCYYFFYKLVNFWWGLFLLLSLLLITPWYKKDIFDRH